MPRQRPRLVAPARAVPRFAPRRLVSPETLFQSAFRQGTVYKARFHRLARARAAARPHESQTGAATPQRDIQPRKPRVKLAPAASLARDRNDLVAMLKAVALERLPPCPRLEVTRRSRRAAARPVVIRHAEIGRQPEPTLKRPAGPLKRPVIPPRRVNLPRHGMHPVVGDVHVEVVGVAMRRRNASMFPEAERPGERALRLPKLRAVQHLAGAQRHDEMIRQVRARGLARPHRLDFRCRSVEAGRFAPRVAAHDPQVDRPLAGVPRAGDIGRKRPEIIPDLGSLRDLLRDHDGERDRQAGDRAARCRRPPPRTP